jgi:hypothetical protein
MKKHLVLIAALVWGCSAVPSLGQVDDPIRPTLDAELDEFRLGLFTKFNEGKYEEMLQQYCHPDVIATWQDGTSGQGYDAVLAEFEKLSKFIDNISVQPDTDLRLIYTGGRMVVASGDMRDQYALARGVDVGLKSRWTATLVKENEKWLLLGFSASTNAFDNEVISLYLRNTTYVCVGIAAVAGLIFGIAGTLLVARRKRPA